MFAIRQFLKEIPQSHKLIFNDGFRAFFKEQLSAGYFVVKSIYFDKPAASNWCVPYHQDLTISVNKKADLNGYGPWTVKQDQFAVQPPLELLKNIITVRIHLDDTDENNGALKVIPGSHLNNIHRPERLETEEALRVSCNVKRGGIMLMKPLLMHSSARTTNDKKRRVIHIEFANTHLPEEILWSEKMRIDEFSSAG